jgi:hypothetical protein
MKSLMTILGTVLIILGVIGFSYRFFTYTTTEKVAEIGNVQITADKEKTIQITPMASGVLVIAGVVLVLGGLVHKF